MLDVACSAPLPDPLTLELPPAALELGGLVVAGLVVAALLPLVDSVVPVVLAKLVVAVVVVPKPLPVVDNGPVLV